MPEPEDPVEPVALEPEDPGKVIVGIFDVDVELVDVFEIVGKLIVGALMVETLGKNGIELRHE